jgi:NADPH-dependent 2,4-dienoyl-CoA reductase/sulfur reductase-like enzyme
MRNYDLIVVGGGPAGLAAATEARKDGVENILVLERDRELGGILQQCIHNGFGLHIFKEELTGPEYAERFIDQLKEMGIEYRLDTMVLEISDDRIVHAISKAEGFITLEAKAVVLAMGCRERTRGALAIPGFRPAGVFTAGTAQRYLNMEGYMVGKKVLILGSGDIGLIMARRMTLEGAKVMAVCELMPFSGGLTRNIVQCLDDYDIPLMLSHTVTDIKGKDRVEGVTVMKVDENRRPIPGTEIEYDVDTLLLSVGLIPENELSKGAGVELDMRTRGAVVNESMETTVPGIFACGNVLHVHDLVDWVTDESRRAGKFAAKYIKNGKDIDDIAIQTVPGEGVGYIVPQRIRPSQVDEVLELFMRVRDVYVGKTLVVRVDGKEVQAKKRGHMAPGEMERVKLPVELFNEIGIKQITIDVEDR